jgi:hypothetical protein
MCFSKQVALPDHLWINLNDITVDVSIAFLWISRLIEVEFYGQDITSILN